MALGDLISESQSTVTSLKVLPSDGTGGIKSEASSVGEHHGRLSGTETGTFYGHVEPDGTATGTYSGFITTPDGDIVSMEGWGSGMPLGEGRTRWRATVKYRTASQKLAWLNSTVGALEAEADPSGGLVAKFYEWG